MFVILPRTDAAGAGAGAGAGAAAADAATASTTPAATAAGAAATAATAVLLCSLTYYAYQVYRSFCVRKSTRHRNRGPYSLKTMRSRPFRLLSNHTTGALPRSAALPAALLKCRTGPAPPAAAVLARTWSCVRMSPRYTVV